MTGFTDDPDPDAFYDLFNIDFPTVNLCIKCNNNYICHFCSEGIKSYLCIDCQPYAEKQNNYMTRHWPQGRWQNKVNDLEYEINPFRSTIINAIYDQKNRWCFECPICYEKRIDSQFLFQLDCRHAVCGICATQLLKKVPFKKRYTKRCLGRRSKSNSIKEILSGIWGAAQDTFFFKISLIDLDFERRPRHRLVYLFLKGTL